MQDLISKYENDNQIKAGIKKLSLLNTNGKYNTGDIITFYGGYTGDILFKSKITGFDKDGDIYVLWDCYWFPIQDNEKRNIKLWHD